MILIDENALARSINTLLRLALKGANGPTEGIQALGHEIGREATMLKQAAGWTEADVRHWLDDAARFREWRDEFVDAYNTAEPESGRDASV